MDILKVEYLALVQELSKAQGLEHPESLLRAYNRIHDDTEPKVTKAMQAVLKRARMKFLRKMPEEKFADLLQTIHKDQSDDIREQIKSILENAFSGAAADLVLSETDLINALVEEYASNYGLKIKFDVVVQKAIDYLEDHSENFFTTLSDEQAAGLLAQAAKAMKSDEGYGIREIAANIRNAFLSDSLYYDTTPGTRSLDTTQWATLVARTETARAASFAQQATLEHLGLQTWEFKSQGSCCDECQENDGVIVLIGDDFPSGDDAPPIHPCCRCIVLPVQAELSSLDDDNSTDEQTPDDT